MAKTITIVTPSLNQGQFIEQTIKSVLSQKGDFFIDYIIADGGSTDNSIEIIKKYEKLLKEKKYPVMCNGIEYRWWSKPDKGQANAFNMGFKIAKGEILSWVNSDDYFFPDVFEKVAQVFENDRELDLIYGDCQKIHEGKKVSSIFPKPRPDETLKSLKELGNSFILSFFTKKILEEVNYIDESLNYCIDLDLWFKIFEKGKTAYLPVIIGSFRIWGNSKTKTSQQEFAKERKLLRKKYGGNIIPSRSIYQFRKKISGILNIIQKRTPLFYEKLKKLFYTIINLFKYKAN